MTYKTDLQANNAKLQLILNKLNALPDKEAEQELVTNEDDN